MPELKSTTLPNPSISTFFQVLLASMEQVSPYFNQN